MIYIQFNIDHEYGFHSIRDIIQSKLNEELAKVAEANPSFTSDLNLVVHCSLDKLLTWEGLIKVPIDLNFQILKVVNQVLNDNLKNEEQNKSEKK